MKLISIVVLILSACFVPVARATSQFRRTNMERWNPCEKVLNVNKAKLGAFFWMERRK